MTDSKEHFNSIEDAIDAWALNYRNEGYLEPRGRGRSSAKEVGEALKTIRDGRLYRVSFDSFHMYCARRWGMRPSRVQQYIDIAEGRAPGPIEPQPEAKSPSASHGKEPIPEEIRWAVWERDDFRCQYCGSRRFLQTDHIIPESRGGSMDLSNLQTLCKTCNRSKGAKTHDEYMSAMEGQR